MSIDNRLRQIPGVRMVAPVLYSAGWAPAMPGFLETIGAKMAMGRPFTESL